MATIYIVKDHGEIKSYFTNKRKAQDYAARHNYTLERHTTDDDLEKLGDAYCFTIELTIVKRRCQKINTYMKPSDTFTYNSKTKFINTNSTLKYNYSSQKEELVIVKTVPCKADITFGDKVSIGIDFQNKIETALEFNTTITDILLTLKGKDVLEW